MLRALASLSLVAGACTFPTDRIQYEGEGAPLAVSVTSLPPPDANGLIARDAVVRVVFDDLPEPDTAAFGPVLLRSGRGNFDIDVRVDLAGHAILIHPRSLLQPSTEYEVVVGPNVRALDGRSVGGAGQVVRISTGEAVAGLPSAPKVVWSEVAVTLQLCSPNCHSPRSPLGVPVRSLDFFRRPADPVYGLLHVPSLSQAGSGHPLERVTPGDSARSVLLRKLLGGNAHEASGDPPYPVTGVDGRRMPIQADPRTQPLPPPPLDDFSIAQIQQWIDDGAIVDVQ